VSKIIAVSITLWGGAWRRVFSPSLIDWARMTGLAFGLIATGVFHDVGCDLALLRWREWGGGGSPFWARPISRTLNGVSKLTGDVADGSCGHVSWSGMVYGVASRLVHAAFFSPRWSGVGYSPLRLRHRLIGACSCRRIMRRPGRSRARTRNLIGNNRRGTYIDGTPPTLEAAIADFEQSGAAFIQCVTLNTRIAGPKLLGALFHVGCPHRPITAPCETVSEDIS